ncbi:outer membrane protein with beta-barrel domain [Gillisia mitskevichiae]|uniref:Outer membrane protein with beta-barrel domain n=1 Tax=Gillisia mitskevichiae TaxID=270921 RepID=A0A495NZY1_9FLAO|nr:outer membrane beta-barrel protein [Gillisia mitskevichiae]RKS42712.1 outer membrane protein with beta-barrel domain [Gillisia mitskevichiae]
MARIAFIILIFLLSTSILNAQYRRSKDTKVGFISGYVYAQVNGEKDNARWNDYGSGVYGGAFVDIYITDKFHLQPAVNFAYVNDFNIIYLPLMLKYQIGQKGFNVQAGTQVTYLLGSEDVTGTKDQFGWELGAGLGMDITKSFFIQGRYTYEVSRRKVDDYLGQPSQDFKFNNIMIGIGYRLSPVDRL